MTSPSKWANYDVARGRLLMQIGELDRLIDLEQSAVAPDLAKIAALENAQSALLDQSDPRVRGPSGPDVVGVQEADQITAGL